MSTLCNGLRKLVAFGMFCATVAVVQWSGRTPEIISSALDALWIGFAAYVTGNVGTHWTQREKGAPNAKATSKTQEQH